MIQDFIATGINTIYKLSQSGWEANWETEVSLFVGYNLILPQSSVASTVSSFLLRNRFNLTALQFAQML
jgi:hypothetical protein